MMTASIALLRPVSPGMNGRPNGVVSAPRASASKLNEMLSAGQRYSLAFGLAGKWTRNRWVVSRAGSY
jgi:hypothetical protein